MGIFETDRKKVKKICIWVTQNNGQVCGAIGGCFMSGCTEGVAHRRINTLSC